jgi:uncharacterized protein
VRSLIGDSTFLRGVKAADFVTDTVGLPTVTDIIRELDKPGRDPRPEFKTAKLQDGVEKITDLKVDMILEGTVTNVTSFGAFVDVGVHQDGLVHISAMSEKFIKDPREAAKAGDIVKVKVMEVDVSRQRIALSMRLTDSAQEQQSPGGDRPRRSKPDNRRGGGETKAPEGAFAAAFAKAKQKP